MQKTRAENENMKQFKQTETICGFMISLSYVNQYFQPNEQKTLKQWGLQHFEGDQV